MNYFYSAIRLAAVFACAVSGLLAPLQSNAYEPLRTEKRLLEPQRETAIRVRTARVVLADYALIRRDFSETRSMTDLQVDEWLLDKTAYVSEAQTAQTAANTEILTGPKEIKALRPKDYGRALVYETGNGGLIDGKGAGGSAQRAFTIRPGGHSDGLATLGEATREFLYEKLVRTVLTHAGSAFETVEHYGVIDWGFDVIHKDGSKSPAGMVLRQAHERSLRMGSGLHPDSLRGIELTLRKYGLTSTGMDHHGIHSEKINIQGTRDGALLDFGAYMSVEKFERPAHDLFSGTDILAPGQIDFVQPNPKIRVPLNDWGYSVSGIDDPKMDNPWIWSHELARDFRRGKATRAAFQDHFNHMVGKYRTQLFMLGGEARAGAMHTLIELMKHVR